MEPQMLIERNLLLLKWRISCWKFWMHYQIS